MTTTLVSILVPAEEAKSRLTAAKQEMRAARKEAAMLLQYGPKDQRTAAKIAKATARADMNDRIVQGCTRALEEAANTPPDDVEEPEQPEPVTEERSIPAMAGVDATAYDGVDEEGG
jgi:hypothetical protein